MAVPVWLFVSNREVRMIGVARAIRRSRGRWATALASAALIAHAAPAMAQGYNEGVSGDLSNSPTAPTPVSLSTGSNLIIGTTGRLTANDPIDADYFTFTLSAGQVLDSITVLEGTTAIGLALIGIDSGNQVTVPGPGATGLLGWTHYDTGDIGTNILDDMSVPNMGSSGFGILGEGTYSVWIQEASPGPLDTYRFDFAIREVPEASTWAMMLAGFGFIGLAFRRRRAPALA